jgi:hypothetical protein
MIAQLGEEPLRLAQMPAATRGLGVAATTVDHRAANRTGRVCVTMACGDQAQTGFARNNSEGTTMNRVHHARCIRRSAGILAGLASACRHPLPERAKWRMTCPVKRTALGAFRMKHKCGPASGRQRKGGRPWLS